MPGTCGAWRVWRDVLEQVLTCGLHLKRLLREQVLRARPHRAWSAPNKGERSALSASAADQPASQPANSSGGDCFGRRTVVWLYPLNVGNQPEAGGRPGTSKISSWPISAAPKQIDWASRQAPHLAAGPGRVWRGTATARTCPLA